MVATYRSKYREFKIEDDNLIWVARGLVGEGGEGISQAAASAMLWAMANRLLLTNITYPGAARQPEYWELWRMFSQPVNPRWDGMPGNEAGSDKEFCAPGGKWYGSKFCTEGLLERRRKISALTWDEIPPNIIQWVRKFQYGLLFPPDEFATKTTRPRISNWSAKWLKKEVDGQLKPIYEVYSWGLQLDGEWFFEDEYLKAGSVSVDSDPDGFSPTAPRSSAGYITIGGLLAIAAAALGYFLGKHI